MDEEGRTPDHRVAVVASDRTWPDRFALAAGTLRRVLPEAILVEHIGSTAVPGLVAKDTIDVLVVIDDLGIVLERAPALAVAGFDLRLGAHVTKDDHLFLRRVVDGHRTHHVHVLLPSSPEVGDYLLFRDYLRAHPEAATRYGEAKVRLAEEHGDDRMAYVMAKPAVLEPLLADARAWSVTRPASRTVGSVTGAMSVQLDHTIVYATDAHASATYLAEMLDLPAPVRAGPFWQVDVDNGVSLDYASAAEEEIEALPSLHLAFLVTEEQFDATYGRITERGIEHFADPTGSRRNEINTHDGGRGVYWADPDGHWLEIITVPYGGWKS